ncbi:MAG: putative sulfate exporter family transporter [Myxococcota bacterium]|jgi:uncharacterized integral membrane protein (TIGR00698 family)|nr:putative sulfate exporter family transporter [Myxococcota bacterium]
MTWANPSMPNDSSWARHLDFLEAGGESVVHATTAPEHGRSRGLLVCAALAAGAALLEGGVSVVMGGRTLDAAMFAMVLGIAVGNSGVDAAALRPGARWIVGAVLPIGIMLLGARLHVADLLGVGLRGLALSVGVITLSFVVVLGYARMRGLPPKLATLLAAGNGICGGSAIVAIAPAINADEEDVAISVATAALLGMLAMFALPAIAAAVAMDPAAFGTLAGLTIQQTPQVIAAGFTLGPEAGEVATVTKLVRISMLAPVVLIAGLTYRLRFQKDEKSEPLSIRNLVPSFAVGLLLLAGITSVGFFPEVTISLGQDSALGAVGTTLHTQSLAIGASKLCLVLAMAAVGIETRWETLRRTGPTAFTTAALGTVVVTSLAAIAISLL